MGMAGVVAVLRAMAGLMMLVGVVGNGSALALQEESGAAATLQERYPMTFPVDGPHSFVDTFGAAREGGRTHQGIDIFAEKLTPVVAVADGTILRVSVGERSGRYIVVEHPEGWRSYYLHLNNDSPGTDDGLLDRRVAGIEVGTQVQAGDLLDYVGDSGNAEATPSHLHFELHSPDGSVVNPYQGLLAANGAPAAQGVTQSLFASGPLPETLDTVLVGHFDPGGGFAAGLAVHAGVAYLGTWGRPEACPATGVRIIDVADPADPQLLGSLADGDEFPGTDTDSVWVGSIQSESFTGEVAVVAVGLCDNRERARFGDEFRGLALYDVTDPAKPQLLGSYHSGARTQGVHEVDVVVRDDGRVLAAATVVQSFPHTEGRQGDLRLVDITDPRDPLELSDWDWRREAAPEELAPLLDEVGDEELHAHSVAFADAGKQLWVANWDAGSILLDVADPTQPSQMSRIEQFGSEEGNVHSVVSYAEKGVLLVASEDLHPEETSGHRAGWGHLVVLDSDGDPLGAVTIPEQDEDVALDGYHTAHAAELHDGLLYTSWYSDGVRIVDLSEPAAPVEIGYFVPPAAVDPQGYWVAPDGTTSFPMVWDVRVVGGLLFVSDMNSGLWIARYGGEDSPRPGRF